MPRDSRHKSHRSRKHSRDVTERSDSEDDGSSRGRRPRLLEAGPGSGTRVSRDVEGEKRKASSSLQVSQEKDKGVSGNGDFSSGRKRKEREEGSATPDRWNVSGKDNGLAEKGSKEESFRHVDLEKIEKSRILTAESKSRSSRRREGSTERYVESGSRTESVKRKSEKEHTRREYRDDKAKDMDRLSEREKDRERVSDRGNKIQDSRHGRSDDAESKSQRSKRAVDEVERSAKKDSTEPEKDPEKFITKRSIDKGLDDVRNSDDRRLSSRDDKIKNGSHKAEGLRDERYKDDRYRDKYYKGLDRDQRDQRHRDTRHRDERPSRDYIGDRLDSNKSVRDRDKHFESYKKSRLHGSDRDELSPHADDHGIKTRGSRLHKRSYDEIDDHYGSKKICTKDSRSNVEKDASNSSKFDHGHQGKVDSSLNNTLSRSSLSPKSHCSKEQIRRGSKQAEHKHGEPACDDRACPTEDHDRVPMALSSEKAQRRDQANSDDRERQLALDSPNMNNNSQADLQIAERASASPSLFKRTSHFSGSSPGHLIPRPPLRHGLDNPSAYEDGMRVASGDRRSNNRYRRSCDPNMERVQGGARKNAPNWPAPLPNRFIPFQHRPPVSGFAIQQFPPPSLFGVRPYMEMNQAGIPYHMHEVPDRFSGQVHPFGWHHPVDNSCQPQMHGWDGGNSVFGDKSQVYRGPDWNRNRHLAGGRGWQPNAEMPKGQNSSMTAFSSPPELTDELRGAHPIPESNSKAEHFQHASDVASHVKQLSDPPENKSKEACLETKLRGASRFQKKQNGDSFDLRNYFSKFEISEDLTHPELYKEIKDRLSKDEDAKNNNKIQNSGKISILKNSLLPAAADATFKRAMSVYEKQSFGRRSKPPAVADCSKEVNVSLEATFEDGMRLASSSAPTEPLTANNNTAASLVGEEDHKTITANVDGSLVHMEVEHVENADDNLNKQSDINPDVDILESSRTCETIMSVCKVVEV